MLKNYLKVALRNLSRFKTYSFINIVGLTIGIACCLLILFYIQNELSYDRFNKNADRIFRINTHVKFGASEFNAPLSSDMMGPILKKDYPQVEEYTRIYCFGGSKLIKKGSEFITEPKVAYVDSTFFKVFTFPAIAGNTDKALDEPNSVVITESIAKKYFGTVDAAGKFIETDENGGTLYKVTAVIKDMPSNSHFRFDFLFPLKNLKNYCCWGNYVSSNFYTYLLLKKGTKYKEFEKNFRQYNDKYVFPYAKNILHIGGRAEFEKAGNRVENSLTPLTDIHLYSTRSFELSPSGTIQYVYIFSAVAFFILLIACINFMNLTTARSANRAREVGIRKVLGTERKNLILQFLIESTLLALLAVSLAVVIAYFALPYFNELAGKELKISNINLAVALPFLLLLSLIIGLLTGSYPAFFISRFIPVEIIKGKLSGGSKNGQLRSALVIFQFVASIILITGTIIIYNQLNYIQNKNLGYQRNQVLTVNNFYYLGNNTGAFKNEMLKVPGIINATVSGFLPVASNRSNNAYFKNAAAVASTGFIMQNWRIDYNYIKTLGMKIIKGRNFSKDFGTDSSAVILNQEAVKQLGFKDPIGKKIYTLTLNKKPIGLNIIGVVKDFNFESLRQDIGALCFRLGENKGAISFKVNAAAVPNILKQAEAKWKRMASGMPFSYSFMSKSFDEMYRSEQRVGDIALTFSALAILIACLGLFGLATFLAEQRTKEIGVRKVLGASVSSILFMLSKEFIKWIIIANVIAIPVAYYFMHKWLQEFAYRINISWWVFAAAGIVALIIALVTVSFQAIKAATANPVESLRYE